MKFRFLDAPSLRPPIAAHNYQTKTVLKEGQGILAAALSPIEIAA
jgi:hypothetical protein